MARAEEAGRGQQVRHRELCGGDDVRGRCVHDHDAGSRRGGHVDVVESHTGAGDHLEARRGGDGLGVHVGRRPDEHGVCLCQGCQQGRTVGPIGLADIEVGTEGLDGGR